LEEAGTDRLPQAFVDCLLDSALEPVLDAAVQRGGQAAKRKRNAGAATQIDGADVGWLAFSREGRGCGLGREVVFRVLAAVPGQGR
jgi:hypothetical protein